VTGFDRFTCLQVGLRSCEHYTHTRTHIHTHAHAHTHTYTHKCTPIYTHTHSHTHAQMCTHTHTHIHTHTHTCVDAHAHAHTHKHTHTLHIHTKTHIYTQTHTHVCTFVALLHTYIISIQTYKTFLRLYFCSTVQSPARALKCAPHTHILTLASCPNCSLTHTNTHAHYKLITNKKLY